MRLKICSIFYLCVILLISGCDAVQQPEFVIQVEPPPFEATESVTFVCARLRHRILWESGLSAEDSLDNIFSNTIFIIDGQQEVKDNLSILVLGPEYEVVDDNGNDLGSYFNSFSICSDDLQLDNGLHSSEIQISLSDNQFYRYTWYFVSR